jgi:hypothetical protein
VPAARHAGSRSTCCGPAKRSSRGPEAEVADQAGPRVLAVATLGAAPRMPRAVASSGSCQGCRPRGVLSARGACCGPAMRSSESSDAKVEDLAGPRVRAKAALGAVPRVPCAVASSGSCQGCRPRGALSARGACCGPAMRSSKSSDAKVEDLAGPRSGRRRCWEQCRECHALWRTQGAVEVPAAGHAVLLSACGGPARRGSRSTDAAVGDLAGPRVLAVATLGAVPRMLPAMASSGSC